MSRCQTVRDAHAGALVRRYARVNGESRRTVPEMVECAEIGGYRHDGHEQGKEDEFVEDGAVVVVSRVGAACMHACMHAYSRLHALLRCHGHLAGGYPVGHCLWCGVTCNVEMQSVSSPTFTFTPSVTSHFTTPRHGHRVQAHRARGPAHALAAALRRRRAALAHGLWRREAVRMGPRRESSCRLSSTTR